MGVAIKVENLSKQYRLGKIGTGSIAHDLNKWWYTIRGKENPYLKIGETNDRSTKGNSDYVWSLKDINFEIEQGDAVGIIGRNGAGKSTLLKILSRVTGPTTGSVKVKGRIASLLEVGTGFHPELSGRENIFLNGAILGMRKHEIQRKFDEIVDFAGVERYIDTPVKRYSSGMYVRLAFAVAAHLESEILIVDEVLAVGDAEFQKKCLGKMGDVNKSEGRTVLFVSHNIASIQNLCKQSILLKSGLILANIAPTSKVLDIYLNDINANLLNKKIAERTDRQGLQNIKILNIIFNNGNNAFSGQKVDFDIEIENVNSLINLNLELALSISKHDGTLVTILSNKLINKPITYQNKSHINLAYTIPKLPLMAGTYKCNVMLRNHNEIEDWVQEAFSFQVENGDYYLTGNLLPDSHNSILLDFKLTQ
jgi:lipopolysaccharide transport system ATP-binding protein